MRFGDIIAPIDTTTPQYRAMYRSHIYAQQGPALLLALSCLVDSLIDSEMITDFADDPRLEQAFDDAANLVRHLRGTLAPHAAD